MITPLSLWNQPSHVSLIMDVWREHPLQLLSKNENKANNSKNNNNHNNHFKHPKPVSQSHNLLYHGRTGSYTALNVVAPVIGTVVLLSQHLNLNPFLAAMVGIDVLSIVVPSSTSISLNPDSIAPFSPVSNLTLWNSAAGGGGTISFFLNIALISQSSSTVYPSMFLLQPLNSYPSSAIGVGKTTLSPFLYSLSVSPSRCPPSPHKKLIR